jgi:hypothetical protein
MNRRFVTIIIVMAIVSLGVLTIIVTALNFSPALADTPNT